MINWPTGYYNTYDPNSKEWKAVLYNTSVPLQASELNAMQAIRIRQMEILADLQLSDGQFIQGGAITIALSGGNLQVSLGAGTLWAGGFFHDVPSGTVNITGVGQETISLVISNNIITAIQDSSLDDPAISSENYNQPGADRWEFNYTYIYGNGGVTVANFNNGQLIASSSSSGTGASNISDSILALLALRTYEESGSFMTTRPNLLISDLLPPASNPAQMGVEIDGGIGYIQGWRRTNQKTQLTLRRTLDGAPRNAEPYTYSTSTAIYSLDNPPVLQVTTLQATVQSPTIGMTRGSIVNGQDLIPTQYQPVSAIVSVTAGMTTYIQGTDYNLSGNYVQWLPGGSQPSAGGSYNLVVNYIADLTPATWTQTAVISESHSGSTSTITLAHPNVQQILSWGGGSYTLGVDYSLDGLTGLITWLGSPPGGTLLITYNYWALTISGDFLCRSSFVDSNSNQIYYGIPTWDLSANTIDYTKSISFATGGSGLIPVNSTQFFVSYNYALSRTDVLAWFFDGTFSIVEGRPSISPAAPALSNQYLGICRFLLPPEAFASNVTIQWFDNLTLEVVDLRNMLQTINDLQYDVAQFQLAANANNLNIATDSIGIFADPLTTPNWADVNNGSFSGTFDFLANTFGLPRNEQVLTPTATSSTATLHGDIWTINQSDTVALAQPYASEFSQLNINSTTTAQAAITLSPATVTGSWTNTRVNTLASSDTHNKTLPRKSIKHSNLHNHIKRNTPVASKLPTPVLSVIPPLVNKITVDSSWLSAAHTSTNQQPISVQSGSTISNNNVEQWPVVTKAASVMCSTRPTDPGQITVTGSGFAPNCYVTMSFNQIPVLLNGTGGATGVQNITASGTGTFTATFYIPSIANPGVSEGRSYSQATSPFPVDDNDGLPGPGSYPVDVFGFSSADITVPISYAQAVFTLQAETDAIITYVTLAGKPHGHHRHLKAAHVFALDLYLQIVPGGTTYPWPSEAVVKACNGSLASLIAEIVRFFVTNGFTITTGHINHAITKTLTYLPGFHLTSAQITTIVSALTLTGTDVTSNTNAVTTALPVTQNTVVASSSSVLDPRAQCFTVPQNLMATSVDLYFNTTPSSTSNTTVQLMELDDNLLPTGEPLAMVTLLGSAINISSNGAIATNFAFPKPVALLTSKDYCVTVNTSDTSLQIALGVLGQPDLINSSNVVAANSNILSLLQSPNQQQWQVQSGTTLKFQLHASQFNASATLNFGHISFSNNVAYVAFCYQSAEPATGCTVTPQYSYDNSIWVDMPPLAEVTLPNSTTSLYFRIQMTGTAQLSPTVVNGFEILTYNNQSSGAYINRAFSLPNADTARYVDLYFDAQIPGNTSITPYVEFNGGSYNAMTAITADTTPLSDTTSQYFWQYDAGSEIIATNIRCKIVLGSTVTSITPLIQNVRIIASSV